MTAKPNTAAAPHLAALNLACDRGGRRVFDGVTFAARPGDLVELRGPNGSGKSSLLRLLSGFLEPAMGTLTLHGSTSYLGHLDAVKPALTAAENLAFWASCLGGGDVAMAIAAFGLEDQAGKPSYLLSQGQRRRLALARLALARRDIWLLDEPTSGLDAASLDTFRIQMKSHLEAGGIIVAATHQDLGLSRAAVVELGGGA